MAGIEPIPIVAGDGALPVSFGQEAFARLAAMFPAVAIAALPAAFRLRGSLDLDALRRALADLVGRHEALRAVLAVEHGRVVQRIGPAPAEFALEPENVSLVPFPAVRERRARHRARMAVLAPFGPYGEPLFKARLLRLGRDDHVLVLLLHHAIADGLSLLIVRRDLAEFYRAHAHGNPAELPLLPLRFADFAAWQRARVADGHWAKDLAYWRGKLAGAPPTLELPTDQPRLAVPDWAGRTLTREFPSDLVGAIKKLAREQRATPFMVLLTAFKALALGSTGVTDIVVRVPTANRPRPELWNLVGCFMNALPFRTSLDGDPSFIEALQRVRRTCLEAIAHQQAPFEALMRAIGPSGQRRVGPAFPVLLQAHELGERVDPAAGELRFERFRFDPGLTLYELSIEFEDEGADRLRAVATYRTALFDMGTIAALLASYERLLGRAANAQSLRLSALLAGL